MLLLDLSWLVFDTDIGRTTDGRMTYRRREPSHIWLLRWTSNKYTRRHVCMLQCIPQCHCRRNARKASHIIDYMIIRTTGLASFCRHRLKARFKPV